MAEKTNAPHAAPSPTPKTNGITKMEAVKRALATLGKEAKPSDIQSFVKAKFIIVMSTDHVSNCKGEIARQAKAKAAPKPTATAAPKPSAKPAHKPAPKAAALKPAAKPHVAKPHVAKPHVAKHAVAKAAPAVASGVSLSDIKTVKDLVGRVGANELRTLIDLLAR
jgi:hypothetical protein